MEIFYLFYAQIILATHKVHRTIKKYSLFFLLTITGTLHSFCQQEPRSSLYMQNKTVYNPGAVGSKNQGDILYDFKQPYGTIKDGSGQSVKPNSNWFAFEMPIKKINSGIGFTVINDNNGLFEKSNNFIFQYAYHLKLGDGKLGIGTNIGFNKLGYDFSKAVYPSSLATGSGGSDQFIDQLKNIKSKSVFNLGLGGYYTNGDLYFGTSFTNINAPKLNNQNYFIPNVYFIAGYTYKPTNPLFVIMPSMQYKSPINGVLTLTSPQLSLSSIIEYNKFLLLGLEYSTGRNVSFIAGANIKNGSKFDGARFLFAYDIITSKLGALSLGKIEFLIGYSFNLHIEKSTKTFKSVRFL